VKIVERFRRDCAENKIRGGSFQRQNVCVIYGCLGLVFIPFALIGGLASFARGAGAIGGIGFLALAILAPVFYAGMGFLMGAITALIYNLAAKWMGGIEIQLEAVGVTSSIPAA
jgi:hypothetical protein